MLYYLCVFYRRDKLKKFLQLLLVFLLVSETVFSATKRKSSKKTTSTTSVSSSVTTYRTPTQSQCNVDIDYCFNRYCFDKKTLTDGVYSKCGAEPASTILINVEDCLATRAIIKKLDLQNGCKSYSYDRVVELLANKDSIEKGLKKNSKECEKATKALAAAKECYAFMISSDGSSSLDLYNRLDELCGFKASGDSYMLNRFYQAGDYGESNLGALEDLRLTNQNTGKRENWRQVVDATLAGYTEIAELACGNEDYKITKVNQYALDSRDNLAMAELKAEAEEIGKQTANRIVNQWFRETDCVNSPLPAGGLYWSYKKGGNPDCKLVCGEGYTLGRDSSSCVKKVDDVPVFITFSPTKKEEVASAPVVEKSNTVIKRIEPNVQIVEETPVSSVNECSKDTAEYTKWYPKSKGVEGVCEVFFPNCKVRYYSRNTESEEFFCTGPKVGVYDKWYNMKLSNDNGMDLNTIFGTNYKRFGNGYKEEMSALIKKTCLKKCGEDDDEDDDPVVEDECKSKASTTSVKSWKNNTNTSGSSKCYPKECQTGYHICDLGKDCCLNECQPGYHLCDVGNRCCPNDPITLSYKETSEEIDACSLPKANAYKQDTVLSYIDFIDNSYTGMCGNRSKYIQYEEWLATKDQTGYTTPGVKYMQELDAEMIEFRKCACKNSQNNNKKKTTSTAITITNNDCSELRDVVNKLRNMIENCSYSVDKVENLNIIEVMKREKNANVDNVKKISKLETRNIGDWIGTQLTWLDGSNYDNYIKTGKFKYLKKVLYRVELAYYMCAIQDYSSVHEVKDNCSK